MNREYGVAQIAGLDRGWAGNLTYIPTAQGWLYLAVVLETGDMNEAMKQELVQDALAMAVSRRFGCGRPTEELLFLLDSLENSYTFKKTKSQSH